MDWWKWKWDWRRDMNVPKCFKGTEREYCEFIRKIRKKHGGLPWEQAYRRIQDRCCNPRSVSYAYYGARGIHCEVTPQILKEFYFRDNAFEMKKASVDRIDNLKGYTRKNTQWLPMKENSVKAARERRRSAGGALGFVNTCFLRRVYLDGTFGKLYGPYSIAKAKTLRDVILKNNGDVRFVEIVHNTTVAKQGRLRMAEIRKKCQLSSKKNVQNSWQAV